MNPTDPSSPPVVLQPVVSAPPPWRDRIRLGALVVLLGLWVLPSWAQAQVGDEYVDESGAIRSGAPAALALLALWGLSATSLAARTLRGLRIGAALTDAVLALTAMGLLVARHPWIPGGEIREAWVPVFGPLALLGVLDAVVVAVRKGFGHEIGVIRAGAALFAAGAFFVEQAWIPAGIAVWLGISPLMFLKLRASHGARRSLEGFILLAGLVAGFAYWIQKLVVGVHPAVGTELTVWVYLWCVIAALVVTTAVDGLMRPEGASAAP